MGKINKNSSYATSPRGMSETIKKKKAQENEKDKDEKKVTTKDSSSSNSTGKKHYKATNKTAQTNKQKAQAEARINQKNGTKTYSETMKEKGFQSNATTRTVEGTIKQTEGAIKKAIAKDDNEYSILQKQLEHKVNVGKISQKEADDYLENWKNTNKTKYEMYKDWEDTKYHKASQKLYDKGEKQYEEGTSEIKAASKGAKGLKKAYLGAVASGTGMAIDMLTGPAWFASMATRVYGGNLGSVKKMGGDDIQDYAFSTLDALKEVGTEMMFAGAGIARYMRKGAGLSVADRLASKATSKMTGKAANIVDAGIKLIGGTAEEMTEELTAWAVDPLIANTSYGAPLIFTKKQAENINKQNEQTTRDQIRSMVSGLDPTEAQSVNAYLSSDKFIEDMAKQFIDEGAPEAEAYSTAEYIKKYMQATLMGDDETASKMEDQLVSNLSEKISPSWSLSELKDTLDSTAVLTLATGLPGTVTAAAQGASIKNQLTTDQITNAAKMAINFEDEEDSIKAQTYVDRLESGKELTNTQTYELYQAVSKQVQASSQREYDAMTLAGKTIQEENLATPAGYTANGQIVMGEATQKSYDTYYNEAMSALSSLNESIASDNEVLQNEVEQKPTLDQGQMESVARAIAGFKTGVFTADDVQQLGFMNTEARTVFSEQTGVDLNDYVVRSNGKVNISATTAKTEQALFAQSAQNLIESARAEDANWVDKKRGEVDAEIVRSMGVNGSIAWQQAGDEIDVKDRSSYMLNASAGQIMYGAGLNTSQTYEEVRSQFGESLSRADENVLRSMFDAGRQDRIDADTEANNRTVQIGEAIDSVDATPLVTGELIEEDGVVLRKGEREVYTSIAKTVGINIVMTNSIGLSNGKQADGMYKDDTIYLNANEKAEKNLSYIFMHEVTHHIKKYAPNEFRALENLVREAWYKKDRAGMQRDIKAKIKLYENAGQELTEAEAMEEIICDSMGAMMADQDFANRACENIGLGKAIIRSIKSALRKLREVYAAKKYNTGHYKNLLNQLGILEEAEGLWMKALQAAVKNKNAVGMIQSNREERLSISDTTDGRKVVVVNDSTFRMDESVKDAKKQDNSNTLYSISEEDAAYMNAVNNGDMESAQKLVDEAASKAGYATLAYRGTNDKQPNVFGDYNSEYNSADPVVYDNMGNVVPLSKRFDARSNDVRYSVSEEEMNNHRASLENDATESYGSMYTNNFAESGYIFPNGKALKMGMDGQRYEDHYIAEIAYPYNRTDPNHNVVGEFVNEGNIRIMPEYGLIQLGQIEPTSEQYTAIMDYVSWNNSQDYRVTEVEITDANFNSLDRKVYGDYSSSAEVVADIRRYYKGGKLKGSSLSQFRGEYELSDVEQKLFMAYLNDPNTSAKYSLSSLSEAVDLQFTLDNGVTRLFDSNGNEVKKVTPELIANSTLGHILTEAVDNNVLPQEDVDQQINFLSDLFDMILKTNDIDLVWAISGTIGYDGLEAKRNLTAKQTKEFQSKFAALTSNSEPQYKKTIDFTTICVKTQAVIDAMSETMKRLRRGLTEDEIIDIVYKEVKMAGEPVPCPVCYVFSRWVGLGKLFGDINIYQKKYPIDMDMSEVRRRHEDLKVKVNQIVKASGQRGSKVRERVYKDKIRRYEELDQKRYLAKVNKAAGNEYENLTTEEIEEMRNLEADLMVLDDWSWLENTRLSKDYKPVPEDILFDINAGRAFATDYPAVWRYRTTRGPRMGKAAVPYSPIRVGQIVKGMSIDKIKELGESTDDFIKDVQSGNKKFKERYQNSTEEVKRQNLMNGQREQSTSDFRFEYALDYILAYIELGALGSKVQGYTKVPESVRLKASVGVEMNCSLMPLGSGIDANGNLVYSNVTGMDHRDAFALSKEFNNVQPILVAISPEHLVKAMASKDITMIIPYHASGSTTGRYLKMMDIVEEHVEDRTDFADYESENDVKDMTENQKLARALRLGIIMGKKETLSEEEASFLKNNEVMRQLYIRFYGKDETGNEAKPSKKYVENFDENGNDADCYHVFLDKPRAELIMPYEYWDKTSTIDTADDQGKAYVEYCNLLGKTPVFAGITESGKYVEEMDFTNKPGYWKTLIDRCMYNNDGSYHKQQPINIKNVDLTMLNADEMRKPLFKPLQTNDPTKTSAIVDTIVEKINGTFANGDEEVKYSVREEDPPIKTETGYKVFYVKDGKLYPPMVANPNGEATPVGVWLNADEGVRAADSKTGRMQVKAGGKGTQGGSGSLSYRPGWHLGSVPVAHQFDRKNPETGEKNLFPKDFVWAECDIAADIDYQEEAMSYGYTDNGKFRHAYAGLPRVPSDGYYRYRTNPDPNTEEWMITGAMKVKRLLSDEEVNKILESQGRQLVHRQGGDKTLEDLGLTQVEEAKYSIPQYIDDEYEKAAQNNNTKKCAELVKQAAEIRGYKTHVYHGTAMGDIEAFEYPQDNSLRYPDGSGFIYFTPSEDYALEYAGYEDENEEMVNGEVYEGYIRMYNTLQIGTVDDDIFKTGEAHISFWGDDRSVDSKVYDAVSEDMKNVALAVDMTPADLLRYLGRDFIKGDRITAYSVVNSPQYAQLVYNKGYDSIEATEFGVTTYGVLNHNQFKLADPITYRDDGTIIPLNERFDDQTDLIKYSIPEEDIYDWFSDNQDNIDYIPNEDPILEEGRKRIAKSKKDFITGKNAEWNDNWLTEGKVLDTKKIKTAMRHLIMGVMANSDTDSKYKMATVDYAVTKAKAAYWTLKEGDVEYASEQMWECANTIIENVDFIDDTEFVKYKEMRDFLRRVKITLAEEYRSEIDYNAFRREYMGRILIGNDGKSVSNVYAYLAKKWPEKFDPSLTGQVDQLVQIGLVLDEIKPYTIAYTSEEAMALTDEIAGELWNIVYQAEGYESTVDKYTARMDKITKAMKARHEEALNAVRSSRDISLMKQRERFKKYKENQKAKANKKAVISKIQKNYKWLSERLLNPTKEKNIPEAEGFHVALAEMLQQFDFQTTRSKNIESEKGYASQKTLKMRALKDRFTKICLEDESGPYAYNEYLIDLMDKLSDSIDGKSVHELDVVQLIAVNEMLKSIKHEVVNMGKIRVEGKKAEAAQYGEATIKAMQNKIDKQGKRKVSDFTTIDAVDRLLNESEETPVYFFERIDPEEDGIGAMFNELMRGEDKHIQNMDFLKNWFDNLFRDYNNTKKGNKRKVRPGSELESWRTDEGAKTFNLEGGSITLSIAQMMSLYCLSKRAQAMGHITGNGIIAAPIQSASIRQRLKGKAEQGHPVMISYDEVNTITNSLTDDQKRIADEMQSLLNGQIAAWGNETSLELYGIRTFKEKNYFPIKVADTAISKDINKINVEEKIKNLGFTKALKKGANNEVILDDIFKVVADHCNKMSLYNALAVPISDFMRVYNYRSKPVIVEYGSRADFPETGETNIIYNNLFDDTFYKWDGEKYVAVSESAAKHIIGVQGAIKEAYSQKANNYINKLLDDINGNTKTRKDGVDALVNITLANYKKAAIGANMRVALQQPTAIVRALMEVDFKYFFGFRVTKALMQDMYAHCPIALWKSWGHYDMDMGRDIEDVMMNKDWSRWDTATMGLYGALDNVTWARIWGAVKKEVEATHPELTVGSKEYYAACNKRASVVYAKTQVVDSITHRSEAMREKSTIVKMMTSFMSEPTLTYNVMRDSAVKAWYAAKEGNGAEATKIATKMVMVLTLNAAIVSVTAAVWDAVRGKGDDDDKLTWIETWWMNAVDNFLDNENPLNNIYYVKDLWSMVENVLIEKNSFGSGITNMAFEGWSSLFQGIAQLEKKINGKSDKSWYDCITNVAGGLGYILGIPMKTIMRDMKPIFQAIGVEVNAATLEAETTEEDDPRLFSYERNIFNVKDGSTFDNLLNRFGINKTEEERRQDEIDDMAKSAESKAKGLTGSEKEEALWNALSDGYTKKLEEGDLDSIRKMRAAYEQAGGDMDVFDEKVTKAAKTAYKKMIGDDSKILDLLNMKDYLTEMGLTESEISYIAYQSDTCRDLKAAFRLWNHDAMVEEMTSLYIAGITDEDIEKAYKNRNRGADTYHGKYKDLASSTGSYNWPAQGTITSGYGARTAPTTGASKYHEAIDIGADEGSTVAAADGGQVISAGWNSGYGYQVVIRHDNGDETYYGHLKCFNVWEGDVVSKGQQIGQVGSTGNSTGPHLDFKLKVNGSYVNPISYLQA